MPDFLELARQYFPYILRGAIVTVELTVFSAVASMALGLVTALARLSRYGVFNIPARIYIELIRATPAILQLFIIYFGLSSYGIRFDPFIAAVLTFTIIGGAYSAEIFRAGIQGVDPGQFEAGKSLGMPAAAVMRRIILPQAAVLILPPMTNFLIGLIKDTALALTISVPEIMYRAYDAASQSFRSLEIYAMAGVIYVVICYPLSRLAKALEARVPPR
jgi:His/Glu/Gln/Arg/opine family amino acid ABC transporter permease subunit